MIDPWTAAVLLAAERLTDAKRSPAFATRRSVEDRINDLMAAVQARRAIPSVPAPADPLAAALDRAAIAITGQPAAELTAQLQPATASIGPEDTAIIDAALGHWSSDDNDAPHADIDRIRALLASPGGGS